MCMWQIMIYILNILNYRLKICFKYRLVCCNNTTYNLNHLNTDDLIKTTEKFSNKIIMPFFPQIIDTFFFKKENSRLTFINE